MTLAMFAPLTNIVSRFHCGLLVTTPPGAFYSLLFLHLFSAAGQNGDEVPTSAVPTLAAIAASIKQSAAGMGQWSMAELTIGLYKLANKHALEGAADTIEGTPVTSR